MKPELASAARGMHAVVGGTGYSVYPRTGGEVDADCETVVLIHGVGMNRSVWIPQIDVLTERYRVVAYDMLGHGESALPQAVPTLGEYARQLEQLLDLLGIGVVHVAGHSMGALVALEFALTRPARTASVIALNAVYDRTPEQRAAVMHRAATLDDTSSDKGVDSTLARWFGDPVPVHLTEVAMHVRTLLLSVDPVGYARTYQLFACSDDAHVGRLARLAMPALFLTGERDPNSSPAMSLAMAAAVPDGRAEVIASERHMMNVTDPERVNERLLAFLAYASGRARQIDKAS
ncbi:alpha/beta fold hydrolase [Burkholderia sp. MR1-5-21]